MLRHMRRRASARVRRFAWVVLAQRDGVHMAPVPDYHEPPEALPPEARDFHRALASLREEIEAVDWYHQRVVLSHDAELRAVMAHNRDEEIEHAAMTLEWLRRNMPKFDEHLRRYLFTSGPIKDDTHDAEASASHDEASGLGIGGRRKQEGQP
jgi:ferritin-like protein